MFGGGLWDFSNVKNVPRFRNVGKDGFGDNVLSRILSKH